MRDVARGVRGAAAAALLLAGAAARAEEPAQGGQEFTLGEVTVVRDQRPAAEAVKPEQMRRAGAGTVSQAADLLPGVTLALGGTRNESLLFVHGFDVKHVPLFLDGMPVYVPYDGYPDLGRFFTYDLSRLVVSRGFTSVLYGPNTMGGAINLVTRRPQAPLEGDVGLRLATGPTRTAWANVGARQERFYEQLSGSWERSDGYRLSRRFTPVPAQDDRDRNNAYHRDWKVSGKVGYTPGPRDEYVLGVSLQHGVKGSPPYAGTAKGMSVRYWRWPYWDMGSVYLATRTGLRETVSLETRAYYDVFRNSLVGYDDAGYTTQKAKSSFTSRYDDATYGGTAKASGDPLPGNTLAGAAHYKVDLHREHNLPSPWQHFEDHVLSLGVEDQQRLGGAARVVAGLSYDRLETVRAQDFSTGAMVDFDEQATAAWNPQLGLFWAPFEGAEAHASVARKSRLPSIKDKYSYRMGTALPNPGLRPEYAVNYELGWEHRPGERLQYSATAFLHEVTDYVLSATVPDPANPGKTLTQNQNVGKVRMYGVEALAGYTFEEWLESGASYTYLEAHNRSNPQRLTNVPSHKLAGWVRLAPWKLLQLWVDGQYGSRRYSSTDGLRVAGAFAVADLKLASEPLPGLVVEAGVQNLFDRDYALEEGFPAPGRTFVLEGRWKF